MACFIFISPLGVRVGLFTPDRAFDMVTKAQIMKLKGPSVKLVDLVCQEILCISRDIAAKVVSQKPQTRDNYKLRDKPQNPGSITGQATVAKTKITLSPEFL